MAMSTDVNLPRAHDAKYPDRCVVCGAASPASRVRVITGTFGWWTVLFWWWGWPFVARAPACNRCGWILHARRFGALLVTAAIVFGAIFYIWPIFGDSVPRVWRKWSMVGLAIVCLLPQFLLAVFFPRPFDVSSYKDSVDYEFADAEYAYDFAEANCDAAWVKIDGEEM